MNAVIDEPITRVRVRYREDGKVRFLSHRDVARVWERVVRRAGLPVAYSSGFSPRPRLHFGLALSVGHESDAEFVDIDLVGPGFVEPSPELGSTLSELLPHGIDVTAVGLVTSGSASLQEAVDCTQWRIVVDALPGGTGSVDDRVEAVLQATSVPVQLVRKGRTITEDLRPLVLDLRVEAPTGADLEECAGCAGVLVAELATKPRAIRPAELLATLGVSGRVRRTHQWMFTEGERREPLSAAVGGLHAGERAS